MFSTLLETSAPRTHRAGGTVVSAAVHGALVAAAVALTLPSRGDARTRPLEPRHEVVYVPMSRPPRASITPPSRRTSHTVATAAPLPMIAAPTITPTSLPPIDLSVPVMPNEEIRIGAPGLRTDERGIASAGPSVSLGQGIVSSALADVIPRLVGNVPSPSYPLALRASGLTGRVVIQFVVDTLGRVEGDRITVLETTHQLFADAVRVALPRFSFAPGEVNGEKVRTMVQLPFTFQLR